MNPTIQQSRDFNSKILSTSELPTKTYKYEFIKDKTTEVTFQGGSIKPEKYGIGGSYFVPSKNKILSGPSGRTPNDFFGEKVYYCMSLFDRSKYSQHIGWTLFDSLNGGDSIWLLNEDL